MFEYYSTYNIPDFCIQVCFYQTYLLIRFYKYRKMIVKCTWTPANAAWRESIHVVWIIPVFISTFTNNGWSPSPTLQCCRLHNKHLKTEYIIVSNINIPTLYPPPVCRLSLSLPLYIHTNTNTTITTTQIHIFYKICSIK